MKEGSGNIIIQLVLSVLTCFFYFYFVDSIPYFSFQVFDILAAANEKGLDKLVKVKLCYFYIN